MLDWFIFKWTLGRKWNRSFMFLGKERWSRPMDKHGETEKKKLSTGRATEVRRLLRRIHAV